MGRPRLRAVPDREKQVAAMPDTFVECRAWGHDWETDLAYGAKNPDTGHTMTAWSRLHGTCKRCGMKVIRIYDQFFGIAAPPQYSRPKGYDVRGTGHTKWKTEARRESFERRLGPQPRGRKRSAG